MRWKRLKAGPSSLYRASRHWDLWPTIFRPLALAIISRRISLSTCCPLLPRKTARCRGTKRRAGNCSAGGLSTPSRTIASVVRVLGALRFSPVDFYKRPHDQKSMTQRSSRFSGRASTKDSARHSESAVNTSSDRSEPSASALGVEISRYLQSLSVANASPHTLRNYASDLQQFEQYLRSEGAEPPPLASI